MPTFYRQVRNVQTGRGACAYKVERVPTCEGDERAEPLLCERLADRAYDGTFRGVRCVCCDGPAVR
jgi:hypothetical protein